MKEKALEIFGWYGAIAIIFAYFLVSFSIIPSKSLLFQLLNLSGAAGIALEAWSKKDYQPAVLNLVWMAVATVAIIKSFV